MSLATFKKKSINSSSSATKISGKPTNEYWVYQGPYGRKGNLPSTIYKAGLDGFNEKGYYTASNSGFSVTGPYRNIGYVGANMRFSKSGTPYRGAYPKGWGGTRGRYPDGPNEVLLNITPVQTGVAVQNATVKPPVLSTKGMLQRRFRWAYSGQYPNNWVQPVYTGNQTDSASQGLYIQNKSAANYIHYDVNNPEIYVDYVVNCGPCGCRLTPARGYKMTVQQANAPYTKTLHQPKDASDYTLRVQRRCQDPVGFQKPFPYAVQTGTGVLRGGINVDNVASSCNTSNPVLVPPDWYTGADVIKADGSKTTREDQLIALQERDRLIKKATIERQRQVYQQTFLEGTTN
jgi:hypothetical protein